MYKSNDGYGRAWAGFTLAELLIALVILGVIATFTIPKVLQSQQDVRYKSIAKEAAGMVSEAYKVYQFKNGPSSAMMIVDLTPYMNFVRVDTSTTVDEVPTGGGPIVCGSVAWGSVYTCTMAPCSGMPMIRALEVQPPPVRFGLT